ncbi:6676_t:CDS:2, partial [Acaulospora colombiana]
IAKEFGSNAEARAYLAERHVNFLDVNSPEFVIAIKDCVNEFQQSVKLNLASEQMYIDWIEWIVSSNEESKFEEVQEIIQKSIDIYPQSPQLWLKRINIVKSYEGQHQDESIDEIYKIALKHNPESVILWNSYISWIFTMWKNGELKDHELENTIMSSISRVASIPLSLQANKGNNSEEVKDLVITRYLNWADENGGLEKARKVYK